MNARRLLIASGIGLGALTALAVAVPLQEPGVAPRIQQGEPHDHEHDHDAAGGQDEDVPDIRVPVPGMDQSQQEMIELFGRVERNLRKIDVLLSDAGAGDTKQLANVGEAGIGLLLNRSLEAGRETVNDIDRILELAAQMGQQQQGECPECASGSCSKGHKDGGSGQGGQQGKPSSPLDKGPQSAEREGTPEQPGGEQPEGKQPGEDGKPEPTDGDPKDGQASDDPDPENKTGGDPPSLALEGPARPSTSSERWGDLPVQTRDIFTTAGGPGMPAQYRDWIDSYYRRLSERAPR